MNIKVKVKVEVDIAKYWSKSRDFHTLLQFLHQTGMFPLDDCTGFLRECAQVPTL